MPKNISHIEDNQIYTVEEDTVIEGSIGKNAEIKVKNGSLHIKGSVLEGASIKTQETKTPNITISVNNPNSFYMVKMSSNVSFGRGGGIVVGFP